MRFSSFVFCAASCLCSLSGTQSVVTLLVKAVQIGKNQDGAAEHDHGALQTKSSVFENSGKVDAQVKVQVQAWVDRVRPLVATLSDAVDKILADLDDKDKEHAAAGSLRAKVSAVLMGVETSLLHLEGSSLCDIVIGASSCDIYISPPDKARVEDAIQKPSFHLVKTEILEAKQKLNSLQALATELPYAVKFGNVEKLKEAAKVIYVQRGQVLQALGFATAISEHLGVDGESASDEKDGMPASSNVHQEDIMLMSTKKHDKKVDEMSSFVEQKEDSMRQLPGQPVTPEAEEAVAQRLSSQAWSEIERSLHRVRSYALFLHYAGNNLQVDLTMSANKTAGQHEFLREGLQAGTRSGWVAAWIEAKGLCELLTGTETCNMVTLQASTFRTEPTWKKVSQELDMEEFSWGGMAQVASEALKQVTDRDAFRTEKFAGSFLMALLSGVTGTLSAWSSGSQVSSNAAESLVQLNSVDSHRKASRTVAQKTAYSVIEHDKATLVKSALQRMTKYAKTIKDEVAERAELVDPDMSDAKLSSVFGPVASVMVFGDTLGLYDTIGVSEISALCELVSGFQSCDSFWKPSVDETAVLDITNAKRVKSELEKMITLASDIETAASADTMKTSEVISLRNDVFRLIDSLGIVASLVQETS